ncbi:hypothetical protein V8C44DRAFT_335473 [Trichoderma aethiopicum]
MKGDQASICLQLSTYPSLLLQHRIRPSTITSPELQLHTETMKLTFALIALIGLTAANPRPQLPTPDDPPPPLTADPPPDSEQTPEPTTTSTSTSKDAPPPEPTRAPPVPDGAICECGYTYCASVLMGMSTLCRLNHQSTPLDHHIKLIFSPPTEKPWSQKQLAEAYCDTPNASCDKNVPATNISSALYICLCDDPDQKVGTNLDLVCGCDKCLNIGPDFRGRCETPCHAGNCQMRLW